MKKEKGPAYLLLYEEMRRKITEGDFAYGDKLPSKRNLTLTSGYSPVTVEHAYALLEEEGYLSSKERSGYFVSYRQEDFFSPSALKVKDYPVSYENRKNTFPASVFEKAARKVLSEYGEKVLYPCEEKGSIVLRDALVRYLGRSQNIHVCADNILIGAGSEYFYTVIAAMFGRSRIYGIETPSYHSIRESYRSEGVRVDELKLGNHGILKSELDRTPASVLHVTPYRSFPTGMSTDNKKRREYIQWAEERNAWIIEDDYASEYSPSLKAEESLCSLDPVHVLYMNTFTETVSPSIRTGYMILPEKLMQIYQENQSFRNCPVPLYIQLIIAELLNSGAFERQMNRIRRKKRNIRKD